jgi:hypothetical protein
LFFSLALAAFSIGGLIIGPQFSPSFKQTQCSIINTFYIFNKGLGTTTGWQGVSGLYTILSNINNNLSTMTTTIDSTFSGSSADFSTE